ncbi:MAG: hypothetical protein OEY28_07680, partial [Nitrospira sp.]|nr:hypothetical protein [Nitrospira sp.]
MSRTWISTIHSAFVVGIMLWLVGCSDVSTSYRFDTGAYPEYQDDEVRFRTTYYLRVFDLCPLNIGKEDNLYEPRRGVLTSRKADSLQLVKDSLFRFRMTGKANALFSNIHFESGVLGADEIDPFGKTLDYDEAKKKFEAFTGALQRYGVARAEGDKSTGKCPKGEPLFRRFYLLGPEGIRELDPNERLIMAMYVNAKPLINSLKHLAGQQANNDAEELLPFEYELSKARAESALSMLKDKEAFAKELGG